MKIRKASIAVTALLVALSAGAQAQGLESHGHRWQSNRQERPPQDEASDRLMRESMARIERAEQEIQKALPIYNGHRDEAMERSQTAQREIRTALMWDHMLGQRRKGRVGARVKASHRSTLLTEDQTRQSNEHMLAAGRLLQEAAGYLAQVKRDYSGYRRQAVDSTQAAIQHVREALRSV